MLLDSPCTRPIEDLPSLGVYPRPAKSPSSLQHWLACDGPATAPQNGRCLLTLERYPRTAIQCTRLVPSDTKHQEVRAVLLWAIHLFLLNVHPSQATCLEWSWGLAPLTLDIDSPSNLLICRLVFSSCVIRHSHSSSDG